MLYYFIINGREDIRARADALLDAQLGQYDIDYRKYYTEGVGDGTRMVRMYCDLYPRDEVCFVACGGSGTVNEVASGIAGSTGKSMAILAFGETNDAVKYWPDRNFNDLGRILEGDNVKVDLIKAGNSYCFNVINVGFDAMVAYDALRLMDRGLPVSKSAIYSSYGIPKPDENIEDDSFVVNRGMPSAGLEDFDFADDGKKKLPRLGVTIVKTRF